MAEAHGKQSVAQGHRRCEIQRRYADRRNQNSRRRLITPSPKIGHNSCPGPGRRTGSRPWPHNLQPLAVRQLPTTTPPASRRSPKSWRMQPTGGAVFTGGVRCGNESHATKFANPFRRGIHWGYSRVPSSRPPRLDAVTPTGQAATRRQIKVRIYFSASAKSSPRE